MPRRRPTSNPISYHKWTKQFYVTRSGRRIYLGPDKEEALKRHHRLGLGVALIQQEATSPVEITIEKIRDKEHKSNAGRKPYDEVLMFKMQRIYCKNAKELLIFAISCSTILLLYAAMLKIYFCNLKGGPK